jgi:hypothetical protein
MFRRRGFKTMKIAALYMRGHRRGVTHHISLTSIGERQ